MRRLIALPLAATVLVAGCADADDSAETGAGPVKISGSATVEPITSYIADRTDHAVDVSVDGSTDGFEKFCSGESDINNASVAIPGQGAPVDYQDMCASAGVEYVELPIALDAITIVKNGGNDWASDLSIDQLREMWSADSSVTRWSDIDPEWPQEEITFYGRPAGSGTRGVFDALVTGGTGLRDDVEESDEIDQLTNWIAGDNNAIGFMGVGNYLAAEEETRNKIDNVSVNGIAPSFEETRGGRYPLARPLFLYVSAQALENDNVESFVSDYLDTVEAVLPRVFFYQLPEQEYDNARTRFTSRTTGVDSRWQE